jgi:hypothetical protein
MALLQRIGRAGLAALMLLAATPAFATQYWELNPVADPAVAVGTYTVVGGKTSPDGVNFTLKNNSIDNPVEMTLIAKTSGARLHLSAFKDDGEAFLDKDTDARGLLTVKFRTGDNMSFKVTGAAGSTYQLSVWRGPAIVLPHPDPVVAMDAVTGHAEGAGAPAFNAPSNPSSAPGSNLVIYGLLAAILIALLGIAFLLYRGQQMRRKS